MNRDEIILMAQEAGFSAKQSEIYFDRMLYRFAALVAAAEREACAKVAENGNFLHDDSPEAKFGKACADAIRARKD